MSLPVPPASTLPTTPAPSAESPAPFAWGLVGPGRIAAKFAAALAGVPGAQLAGVCSRDPARAAAFVDALAAARPGQGVRTAVYPNLDALLAAPQLQAVYVATPHAFHADSVRRCLLAGKAVLCEKPLVTDALTAQALAALAAQQQVFLMEAVWTRFLPIYGQVAQWLQGGRIGHLRSMQSSFCFAARYDPGHRVFDPAQAGGALLDIGIYNLSVTRWALSQVLGHCPEPLALDVVADMAPTGVDRRLSGTLHFGEGLASQWVCGFDGVADNSFHLLGSEGRIVIEAPFWGAERASLWRDGEVERAKARHQVNGFEYEIAHAQQAVRAGRLESAVMPLGETVATLRWMDAIRARIGLRYPFDPD